MSLTDRYTADPLHQCASQVPGMVYQFDRRPDGTYAIPYASPGIEALYGFSTKALRGDAGPLLANVHPEDQPAVVAAIEASAAALGPFAADYRYRHPDGRERRIHAHSIPERLADGTIRWHGFSSDITQQYQLEQRLRQARDLAEASVRAKTAFLATMSHEIRTPMNGIIGMLDLLRVGILPGEQAEYADLAHRSALQLLRVLDDILDHARLEAGRMTLERRPFDLATTTLEAMELFRIQAEQAGFILHADLTAGPWRLEGDASRVRQIIANLVGNAVKFTRQGQVVVRLERREGYLAVIVADTGIGIPAETLTTLFQPFVQGDPTFTRRYGGCGLGLAITRELADLMGARVEATSQVGVGSTFTLLLPVAPAGVRPFTPSVTGLRVLVVEDDPGNRALIRRILLTLGHRPELVADGAQALQRLAEGGLDLVLMDLLIPVVDGLETTRRWRIEEQRSGVPRLPIIALTACALTTDRAACLEAGMDEFLTKPVFVDQLDACLRRFAPPSASGPREPGR
jgi:signal transduction histidine kinase/ActR/RegA family two-component response regulator